MPLHAFVDESKEPNYLMVSALIRAADLVPVRKALSAMRLSGQRRIHFNNERDQRRSQIVARLAQLPIEAVVVEARVKDQKIARSQCLAKLIEDQTKRDVRRLVLERDDALVEFDRRFVRDQILKTADPERMSYDHLRAHEEPLLSVPDAIAWCWAHGGHWRAKVRPQVIAVHEL